MANYANLPAPTPEGGLNRYMQEIRKFPLLEKEEEYMLAKSWVEKQDTSAAHRMVTSHLRLAAKIARPFLCSAAQTRVSTQKLVQFRPKLSTVDLSIHDSSALIDEQHDRQSKHAHLGRESAIQSTFFEQVRPFRALRSEELRYLFGLCIEVNSNDLQAIFRILLPQIL